MKLHMTILNKGKKLFELEGREEVNRIPIHDLAKLTDMETLLHELLGVDVEFDLVDSNEQVEYQIELPEFTRTGLEKEK